MGSTNSQALSFNQISQACLRVCSNKPRDGFCVNYINPLLPNLYTSTSFLMHQKLCLNHPEYPAILKNSITANFNGLDLTATLQNSNRLAFNAFSFDAHVKPNDNIDCNVQASFINSPVFSFMTNYASSILNGNISLLTTSNLNHIEYKISSGFAVNDILHLGLGISQDDQTLPFKLLTSGFVNLGALQFSTSFEKLLKKNDEWNYTFGTNLLLDPLHIINLCFETNQKETNGSFGFLFQVNNSNINATISTDGQLTSLFSHKVNDQIHLDTGISLMLSTLTVSPSIDIQISS